MQAGLVFRYVKWQHRELRILNRLAYLSLMKRLLFLVLLLPLLSAAQPRTDTLLRILLLKSNNRYLRLAAANPDSFRVQIIYTQINRDRKNRPSFRNYYFNVDPNLYFNPASMVKMPLAFLALEKLNKLEVRDLNKYTAMEFDSSWTGQRALIRDTTSIDGKASIAHFIKRAFLISENDPYNRLYQFLGQGPINRSFKAKGYPNSRITRMFMGFDEEGNRHTNAIRFFDHKGKTVYTQPAAYNSEPFDFPRSIFLGRAHMNSKDELIPGPFDFTKHNNLPLEDLQQMLQSVLFPESVPKRKRFEISEDDERFLYRYLSQYPSETPVPKYDADAFYDSYVKFFFRDSTKKMPPGVRVFNKVGWSYGFLTDVSYVADFNNNIEYMLSATIYVNSDGVINDGKYDYETMGHPFLHALGQQIYRYELGRHRDHRPNLDRFRIDYEKRDPKDTRPVVKEVDN